MATEKTTPTLSRWLRSFRSVHKYVGIVVMAFLLMMALTGVLLGWKKHVPAIMPETAKGSSTDLRQWRSWEELTQTAADALRSRISPDISVALDRIDARPDKGVVKFVYLNHYWEVQLDGATGEVKSIGRRHSDLIERIHDGSIISDGFKLAYTNVVGWGLIGLTVTGLGLWYGPKLIRKKKQHGKPLVKVRAGS